MSAPLHVVKVGGSLLTLTDLPRRLLMWHQSQPAVHHLLLVGGGRLVDDLVERADRQQASEVDLHWAAIETMDLNTRLLAQRLGAPVREAALDVDSSQPGLSFCAVEHFLRTVEPTAAGAPLPASRDVTSDSIAGRLAVVLGAQRLVLLKSCLPDESRSHSLDDLAAAGYVDRFLPSLAAELPPAECVNLRGGGSD